PTLCAHAYAPWAGRERFQPCSLSAGACPHPHARSKTLDPSLFIPSPSALLLQRPDMRTRHFLRPIPPLLLHSASDFFLIPIVTAHQATGLEQRPPVFYIPLHACILMISIHEHHIRALVLPDIRLGESLVI